MNSRLTQTLASLVLLFQALVLLPGLSAQTGSGGKATGQTPTSTGTTTLDFAFPAAHATLSPGSQARDFTVVPLPEWHEPEGLGQDGSVLLYDLNTATFVRWRNGQMTAVQLGTHDRVNDFGEILRELPSGAYALEKTDGTIVNVNFDLGPLSLAHASDFSSKFAVGYMAMEMAEGFPRYAPVKWDFAGTYTQLAPMAPPLEFPSFQPTEVNERGDFLAQTYLGPPDFLPRVYLNDRFFDGFLGHDLNNGRAVLLVDAYLLTPPVYWSDSSHPIGSNPGLALSMNDSGEVLGYEFDGAVSQQLLLWTPATDANGHLSFTSTDLQAALGLTIDRVKGINNSGMILLAAWNANDNYQPFLLVPKADKLGVDFDRDGVINNSRDPANPDRELARRQLPWHFWVNDDNDAGETDGNDIPGGGSNGTDGQVNGARDLVDFFPVHLDIAGLLREYPANDPTISYQLAQIDSAANYLPTELTPATAGNYHRDAILAGTLGARQTIQITDGGVILDPAFLDKILTADGGIILVEARKPTKAPLRLEVWRSGTRVGGVELPLSFAGVESMFRHRNLVDAVNVHPATADRPGAPNWPDELNNKQAFVFVHGYNVSQKQARGWHAEFFKRLWWSGSRAQFWGVTWYGSDSQIGTDSNAFTPNYHLNVTHAFGSSMALQQLLAEIDAHPDIHEMNVAAHSLGNMVASSAISDHKAPATRYFLLNAAVATEAYDAAETSNLIAVANMPHTTWTRAYNQAYPTKLWASHWYDRFPVTGVDKRRHLTWRDRFSNRGSTAYYDLFSTGDHVLALDTATTPTLVGVLATELRRYIQEILATQAGQPSGYRTWAYQEKLKGRTTSGKVLGSNYGGWGFNNIYLKKSPGGAGGKGPVVAPVELKPSEAIALLPIFTDEALREEPFFNPGGSWTKVGTWTHDTGKPVLDEERLRLLYNAATGSEFAKRHRDTLLARMVPALSLVTGQDAVEAFTPANSVSRSFDINLAAFRGETAAPPWPATRNNANWRHSDLRVVAYPYVESLYTKLVELGSLDQSTQ